MPFVECAEKYLPDMVKELKLARKQVQEIDPLKADITAMREALGGKKAANWAIEAIELRNEVADTNLKNHQLRAELERYKAWVQDLQSGMYVNCVYCGHQYGPSYKVPGSMADVLKQHIEHCPEHPMSKLRAELELTKKALFLSCVDDSDHCCPNDFSDLVVWEKCATCPAKQPEARYDIERDANCWRDYYIEKAENQAKEAK